jgi:hypothetical protein
LKKNSFWLVDLMFRIFLRILGRARKFRHTNFWLLYTFQVLNILFCWKNFDLVGRFDVPTLFFKILGRACKFRRVAPIRYLTPLHFRGTKHTFLGKFYFFLRFWVEPANSVGWLFYTFKVRNILFLGKFSFWLVDLMFL